MSSTLALGHLKALDALARVDHHADCLTVNLGTGNGYSVLDIVRAFETASGKPVPYKIAPRRPGDVAVLLCRPPTSVDDHWVGRRRVA